MFKLSLTIKDLTSKDVKEGIFVKVVNPKMKSHKDEWGGYPSFNFAKHIIILNITNCGDKTKYLKFISDNGTEYTVVVPFSFKIKRLTGKDLEQMKDIYNLYLLKNLHKQLPHGFTIGSDPEIFVEDSKGEVIPAFNFLGSKSNPNTIAGGNDKCYWDGFQAEFTTVVGTCLAWQVDAVQRGMRQVLVYAKEHKKDAVLSAKTVVDIPQKLLEESKPEHVEFGCMPSLNVYDMKGEMANGRDVPFRPAGGHIHFGCGKLNKTEEKNVVKALDAILGVACVSLFAKFDNPKRRQLYGLAGEYRLPPHGLEYRVLSNAWMFHPLIMNLVFDVARKAFIFGQKGFLDKWDATEKETIETINKCDVENARKILKRNKIVFKEILKAAYHFDNNGLDTLFNVFMHGMESVVKDASNFEKNWHLFDGNYTTHSDGKNKNVKNGISSLIEKKKVA